MVCSGSPGRFGARTAPLAVSNQGSAFSWLKAHQGLPRMGLNCRLASCQRPPCFVKTSVARN